MMDNMHLKDLASCRQITYKLLSATLLYPDKVRVDNIKTAAAELRDQQYTMADFIFFPQWKRLLASLNKLPDQHDLEAEYVRLFIHNPNSPESAPCLPYESVYTDNGDSGSGWLLARLEREYGSAGLAISPLLKDLPDHVAVEMEFMSYLCGQEADLWGREAVKEGIQILERQAGFLTRHLYRWLPQWTRRVETYDRAGIYSVVAEAVRIFTSHDQDLVNTVVNMLQEDEPGHMVNNLSLKIAG
jgi:TorA maturation chaperone TorD